MPCNHRCSDLAQVWSPVVSALDAHDYMDIEQQSAYRNVAFLKVLCNVIPCSGHGLQGKSNESEMSLWLFFFFHTNEWNRRVRIMTVLILNHWSSYLRQVGNVCIRLCLRRTTHVSIPLGNPLLQTASSYAFNDMLNFPRSIHIMHAYTSSKCLVSPKLVAGKHVFSQLVVLLQRNCWNTYIYYIQDQWWCNVIKI